VIKLLKIREQSNCLLLVSIHEIIAFDAKPFEKSFAYNPIKFRDVGKSIMADID
jgi:hypothetical protein